MKAQSALIAAAGLMGAVQAQASPGPDPKRLPLPPMGFNNWARYMTGINETIFVDAANAMAKYGLLAAGYNRLNLDDAWSTKTRAANGSMEWDTAKFPRGLPWLTSFMRQKGFIPGIYSDAGTLSCGGYPATYGYEELDLQTFSDWGFDYLKLDGCNVPAVDGSDESGYHDVYGKWFKLLAAFPKTVVFSDSAPAYFCGADNLTDWYTVMNWAADYGQLARHSYDVQTYPNGNAWQSIMSNYGQQIRLARYQQPGYFNDPDFLITDNPSLSMDEKMSHFALWATFSAPLIISADIPSLSDAEIKFLSNEDFIAVSQDPLVQQAMLVSSDATWDVLTKSLANGDRVLTVLNKGAKAADLTVAWNRLGVAAGVGPKTAVSVKNLWTGTTSKVVTGDAAGITANAVPSHGTAAFRVSSSGGALRFTPTGLIFNTFSLKCLTDDKSGTVAWAACDSSDAQTWVVRDDGHINSLLRPDECIVSAGGKIMSRHSGCHTDAWTYYKGGNLVNDKDASCLTENADGSASAAFCEYETNEQVVALPVGGKVVDARQAQRSGNPLSRLIVE